MAIGRSRKARRDLNCTIKHSFFSTLLLVGYFFTEKINILKETETASYWLLGEFDQTQMLRKPRKQSEYIIFCSGTAAVEEGVWYTNTASARNLQPALTLEFDLSKLKVQYRSSSLQLQCGPVVF